MHGGWSINICVMKMNEATLISMPEEESVTLNGDGLRGSTWAWSPLVIVTCQEGSEESARALSELQSVPGTLDFH